MRDEIARVIEAVELAPTLADVANVKKLTGSDHFYRIRRGNYRIGIGVTGGTVDFVRCLPRKDLYRYFP